MPGYNLDKKIKQQPSIGFFYNLGSQNTKGSQNEISHVSMSINLWFCMTSNIAKILTLIFKEPIFSKFVY